MGNKNRYKISYHLLSDGLHNISFDIDSQIFEVVDGSEILGGNCVATILLRKSLSQMRLEVNIKGSVSVNCDRCLDEISTIIDFNGILIVRVTNEINGTEYIIDDKVEDTLLINPIEEDLDLESYLHDSIILALPLQRIHTDDENGNNLCNKDMLSRFGRVGEDEEWDDEELDEE